MGVDLLLIDTGIHQFIISSWLFAIYVFGLWLNIGVPGDLHDGAGLTDVTDPNGLVANPIFENVPYDLLTIGAIFSHSNRTKILICIGNHELYVTDIAYETFNGFSKVYGERYLTSNVQIINPATGTFEYIGNRYRYFTTNHGKPE